MSPTTAEPDAPSPSVRSAKDYAEVRDWPGYYSAMAGAPPRPTLLQALERFDSDGGAGPSPVAVDLGCGEGRDTVELLRRSWSVLAIDGHAEAFRHLQVRLTARLRPLLQTRLCDFADVRLPPCDLVNASFALPFCPPSDFPGLWGKIIDGIHPGGRFAGQFFGDRDEWARLPDRTHHTRAEVLQLLEPFDLETFDEDERQGQFSAPNSKHWHVFHVVARKREAPGRT